MKKKCPECSGFGIGVYDNEVKFCRNCDGSGEIIVKYEIRRVKGYSGEFLSHVEKPWGVEHPSGYISFHSSHDDALELVNLEIKTNLALSA